MDKDGYISNGELYQVLKMMVGNNLKDHQLQQIVDKTIIHADADGDGKISFEEFCSVRLFFRCFQKINATKMFNAYLLNIKLLIKATRTLPNLPVSNSWNKK